MNRDEIRQTLNKLTGDIQDIADVRVSSILNTLLNLVEVLVEKNASLEKENQKLKDEINRMKGEQGKPHIRKQTKNAKSENTDHSSEEERKKRNKEKSARKKKLKKKKNIKIDRRITVEIDVDSLPADAIFKGYKTRVIQDIKINTDNIEFTLPVYYSPSQNKTFLGKLPLGYSGDFGSGIHALVITLYRDSGMTEAAIKRFLTTFHVHISKATISRMLTEGHDEFHQEKENIIDAGLKASSYQHLDDTGSRVKGKNHYTHILCNPYFTAFFTQPKKDRLTLLTLLCRDELKFSFNQAAYDTMTELGLSHKRLIELKKMTSDSIMTRQEIDVFLSTLFPNPKKHTTNRRIIREAAAIVYYHSTPEAIQFLLCDDAPQFNLIALYKALCWIHQGRHYKKLEPIVAVHRQALDNFIEKFWDYYDALLTYKQAPSVALAHSLSEEFDVLFSTKTGYEALDMRIAMTFAKKESLLLVLTFPFLPLHNNPAELGARVQARMRDINLHTMSDLGTAAKDTFATLVQTAKKLGVNIYQYIYDRVSKTFAMPSLADLIIEQSSCAVNSS
jgi:hypothetical protein